MKFVFAIFVLLVLLTEGMRCSEVRQAKHENHNNMRQLLNTAVRQDAHATKVGFTFPVEVDLTKMKAALEARFAVIDMMQKQLADLSANVSVNGERISTNGESISQNGEAIGRVSHKMVEQLADLSANVSVNGERISANGESISQNGEAISKNGESISAIKTEVDAKIGKAKASFKKRLADVNTTVSANGQLISQNGQAISTVNSKAKSNTKEIERLHAALKNLTESGISFCQTGVTGCNDCGGRGGRSVRDTISETDTVTTKTLPVIFPKEFPGIPTVTSAMNEIYQTAIGDIDNYGWRIKANTVTSRGFDLKIDLIDRKITKFYANWIACYTA